MQRTINVGILGSTGSIGRSSLEVIAAFPERFRVTMLTAHRNIDLLHQQIEKFHPRIVVVADSASARTLCSSVNGGTRVLVGEQGLIEASTAQDVDLLISALVGFAGLIPTLRAIEAGKDVALANKETLVVGGALILEAVRRSGTRLLPVDSEHSAIMQCLQGEDSACIERLILTASGGPFRTTPFSEFQDLKPEQALSHPTWQMGNKITIDSATLMNKGLEVIEAHWLFGLPQEKIEVVVHPQSIIHSMVEFIDGSIKAQLGIPDMKLPIQYALMHPERGPSTSRRLDLSELRTMTFFPPDFERFPCLSLAYDALKTGGSAPAALNAANEVAVRLFLEGRIGFMDIPAIIGDTLASHSPLPAPTIEELIAIDHETREAVRQRAVVVD